MLFSLIRIVLRVMSAGTIPPSHGYLLHGALFHAVGAVDASYANTLHNTDEDKPFSLSLLRRIEHGQQWQMGACAAGSSLSFDIGVWDDALAILLLKTFQTGETQFSIGDVGLLVTSARVINSLSFPISNAAQTPCQSFVVRFLSPTGFRSKGRTLLFPETRLLLSSVARKYASACGTPIPDILCSEIYEEVLPTKYALETSAVRIRKSFTTGFHGECRYRVLHPLSEAANGLLKALLSVMPYTGVGYKTTMGMGKVEVRELDYGVHAK